MSDQSSTDDEDTKSEGVSNLFREALQKYESLKKRKAAKATGSGSSAASPAKRARQQLQLPPSSSIPSVLTPTSPTQATLPDPEELERVGKLVPSIPVQWLLLQGKLDPPSALAGPRESSSFHTLMCEINSLLQDSMSNTGVLLLLLGIDDNQRISAINGALSDVLGDKLFAPEHSSIYKSKWNRPGMIEALPGVPPTARVITSPGLCYDPNSAVEYIFVYGAFSDATMAGGDFLDRVMAAAHWLNQEWPSVDKRGQLAGMTVFLTATERRPTLDACHWMDSLNIHKPPRLVSFVSAEKAKSFADMGHKSGRLREGIMLRECPPHGGGSGSPAPAVPGIHIDPDKLLGDKDYPSLLRECLGCSGEDEALDTEARHLQEYMPVRLFVRAVSSVHLSGVRREQAVKKELKSEQAAGAKREVALASLTKDKDRLWEEKAALRKDYRMAMEQRLPVARPVDRSNKDVPKDVQRGTDDGWEDCTKELFEGHETEETAEHDKEADPPRRRKGLVSKKLSKVITAANMAGLSSRNKPGPSTSGTSRTTRSATRAVAVPPVNNAPGNTTAVVPAPKPKGKAVAGTETKKGGSAKSTGMARKVGPQARSGGSPASPSPVAKPDPKPSTSKGEQAAVKDDASGKAKRLKAAAKYCPFPVDWDLSIRDEWIKGVEELEARATMKADIPSDVAAELEQSPRLVLAVGDVINAIKTLQKEAPEYNVTKVTLNSKTGKFLEPTGDLELEKFLKQTHFIAAEPMLAAAVKDINVDGALLRRGIPRMNGVSMASPTGTVIHIHWDQPYKGSAICFPDRLTKALHGETHEVATLDKKTFENLLRLAEVLEKDKQTNMLDLLTWREKLDIPEHLQMDYQLPKNLPYYTSMHSLPLTRALFNIKESFQEAQQGIKDQDESVHKKTPLKTTAFRVAWIKSNDKDILGFYGVIVACSAKTPTMYFLHSHLLQGFIRSARGEVTLRVPDSNERYIEMFAEWLEAAWGREIDKDEVIKRHRSLFRKLFPGGKHTAAITQQGGPGTSGGEGGEGSDQGKSTPKKGASANPTPKGTGSCEDSGAQPEVGGSSTKAAEVKVGAHGSSFGRGKGPSVSSDSEESEDPVCTRADLEDCLTILDSNALVSPFQAVLRRSEVRKLVSSPATSLAGADSGKEKDPDLLKAVNGSMNSADSFPDEVYLLAVEQIAGASTLRNNRTMGKDVTAVLAQVDDPKIRYERATDLMMEIVSGEVKPGLTVNFNYLRNGAAATVSLVITKEHACMIRVMFPTAPHAGDDQYQILKDDVSKLARAFLRKTDAEVWEVDVKRMVVDPLDEEEDLEHDGKVMTTYYLHWVTANKDDPPPRLVNVGLTPMEYKDSILAAIVGGKGMLLDFAAFHGILKDQGLR